MSYNIGSEKGFSVLDVIKSIERITQRKVKIIFKQKRKGDPPILVAKCKKILQELNWKPKYNIKSLVKEMIQVELKNLSL